MTATLPAAGPDGICVDARRDIQGRATDPADAPPIRTDRRSLALDVTALPLPPEARAVLRTIADEVRKPPPDTAADPIALRRWLDRIGRRLDGLAAIRAGAVPAAPSVERRGVANPRAALRAGDRPAGIVVETRGRGGSR